MAGDSQSPTQLGPNSVLIILLVSCVLWFIFSSATSAPRHDSFTVVPSPDTDPGTQLDHSNVPK